MSGEALRQAGVEVPEGADAGAFAELITDLLRAAVQAKLLGHFEVVKRDVDLGAAGVWNFRLKGHRQQKGGDMAHQLSAEHKERIEAAASAAAAQGFDWSTAVNVGIRAMEFVVAVAVGAPASENVHVSSHGHGGTVGLTWTPDAPKPSP